MKTKTSLSLFILSASMSWTSAQVIRTFPAGEYVFICNPMNHGDNHLSTVFTAPTDSTTVYSWDFSTSSTFSGVLHAWSVDMVVAPGTAFWVQAGSTFDNIFTATTPTGPQTYSLVGGGNAEPFASKVLVTRLSDILKDYPATDGDVVYHWNVASQDFDPISPTYDIVTHQWVPDVDYILADSLFIVRQGGAVTWTRCN